MTLCAISLPAADWKKWINPVKDTIRLCNVMLPAELLQETSDAVNVLSKNGITAPVIRDIIPLELLEYIVSAEDTKAAFEQVWPQIYNEIQQAEVLDAHVYTLQIPPCITSVDSPALANMVSLAEYILRNPLQIPLTLLFQVRVPFPFPTATEYDCASELCRRIDSPYVGLYLHFHPDEYVENNGDMDSLVKEVLPKTKAISFHYDTRVGETLFDDEQYKWAQALSSVHFPGVVIFAPSIADDTELDSVCKTVLSWADFYTVAP